MLHAYTFYSAILVAFSLGMILYTMQWFTPNYFRFNFVFTGKAWDDKVHDNAHSFGEIYNLNSDVCPSKLQGLIAEAHDAAWQTL